MSLLLIAGIGSAHGADSLGWQVSACLADDLSNKKLDADHVAVASFAYPSAALNAATHCEHIIFVDAFRSEMHAYGELITIREEAMSVRQPVLSSHDCSLSAAISLGRQLQLLPDDCMIVGVNVHPFEARPVPERFLQSLISTIYREIARVLNSSN